MITRAIMTVFLILIYVQIKDIKSQLILTEKQTQLNRYYHWGDYEKESAK